MFDGTPRATAPRKSSSGAYPVASAAVTIAACPPCDCPSATQLREREGSTERAARTMSTMLWASDRPSRYGWIPGVPRPT